MAPKQDPKPKFQEGNDAAVRFGASFPVSRCAEDGRNIPGGVGLALSGDNRSGGSVALLALVVVLQTNPRAFFPVLAASRSDRVRPLSLQQPPVHARLFRVSGPAPTGFEIQLSVPASCRCRRSRETNRTTPTVVHCGCFWCISNNRGQLQRQHRYLKSVILTSRTPLRGEYK